MAHYAKLDNNNVLAVHVVNNSVIDPANEEQSGADYLNNLYGIDAVWKQTSYNGKIRFNYAGVNYTYDEMQALAGAEKGWIIFETLLFVYFLEFVPTRRTKFIGIFFSFFSTVSTIHF